MRNSLQWIWFQSHYSWRKQVKILWLFKKQIQAVYYLPLAACHIYSSLNASTNKHLNPLMPTATKPAQDKAILTHWGLVSVSKHSILGSDNGLSPGRRQAIIWTNAGILLIGPLGTNFS